MNLSALFFRSPASFNIICLLHTTHAFVRSIIPLTFNMDANAANAAQAAKSAAARRGSRAGNSIPSPHSLANTRTRGRLNPENNNPPTKASNTYAACLAAAQEEETRLQNEEQRAQEEEEIDEVADAKLRAILARVEQLKAAKAEREARQTRQGATALTTLGGPRSTLSQGKNSLTSVELVSVDLFNRYPAIDKVHFKAIKQNKLEPTNLVKLTTETTLDRNKVKVLTAGVDVALETREEDALLASKGAPHLIRCFLFYMSILLHFTHDSLEKSFRIGILAYVKHLWGFSSTCTFDSISQYQFLFLSLRIQRGA